MHIPADDETLRAHLQHANLPALLPAIVQLTGDASLLDRFDPPTTPMMGAVDGNLSEGVQAELRELAFQSLAAYRDGDGTLPPLPSHEILVKMMNWCAGEAIPAEYVPLAIEEGALEEEDPRHFEWNNLPDSKTLEDYHVLVVGGGFGGICAGVRLGQAGIPYTICEKNEDIGGTWHENSYPDLRVDIANHFYSFSFANNPDWTNHFSMRDEIKTYARGVAEAYDVDSHVRLGTEVVRAEYDEATALWNVRIRGADGREERLTANALISAVGMLNRPQTPDIPGLETFDGTCFHSSSWDHDLDFEGKRVGVIGTGASAMQFVPRIAEHVAHLTVFQRAAHWVSFNPNYRAQTEESFRWCLKHIPFHHSWYRFLMFWAGSDKIFPVFQIDPEWTDSDHSTSMANDFFRQGAIAHMTEELGWQRRADREMPPRLSAARQAPAHG